MYAVFGCGIFAGHKSCTNTYSFPKNDVIRKQWIAFVRRTRKDFTEPTKYECVWLNRGRRRTFIPNRYRLRLMSRVRVRGLAVGLGLGKGFGLELGISDRVRVRSAYGKVSPTKAGPYRFRFGIIKVRVLRFP